VRGRGGSPIHWYRVSTNLLERPTPSGSAIAARGLRQWTSPTRLKACTALVAALTVILVLIAVTAVGSLRTGVDEIGRTAGPEVENTAALSRTLSDLDAQVANLLLAGRDPAFAGTERAATAQFTADQTAADATLRKAIAAAGPDTKTQQSIQTLLDGLAAYQAEVADVRLLETQSAAPAGRPDAAVLAQYDQATDLMRDTLIPAANALSDGNDSELDSTYASQRSSAQDTLWLLAGVGALLVVALILFQLYLTRAFKRLLNPFLAAATAAALVLTVLGVSLMNDEVNELTVAKVDAFDSVIALSQAQEVSSEANADESRYLVDPGRATRYQQDFQNESQQLLFLSSSTSVFDYDGALAAAVARIPNPPPPFTADNVAFGGFLGTELNNITFPGEGPAALAAVQAYQAYEKADRVLRADAAAGDLTGAIAYDTGAGPTQSDGIYANYLTKLQAVTAINENAFTAATGTALGNLGDWTLLPIVLGLIILALALLGVRLRLAEYQ
jgi:hypothetical protein